MVPTGMRWIGRTLPGLMAFERKIPIVSDDAASSAEASSADCWDCDGDWELERPGRDPRPPDEVEEEEGICGGRTDCGVEGSVGPEEEDRGIVDVFVVVSALAPKRFSVKESGTPALKL